MRKKNPLTDSSADLADVDLTPLIDVVFVVLIMFILVAPMLEMDKVKLAAAPPREHTETTGMSDLVIHVRQDNTILINKHVVALENIEKVLQAAYKKDAKLTPQLFQDYQAQFGTYQKVKNALELAGFTELDVVLEPSK